MISATEIQPDAIYSEAALAVVLQLPRGALAAARHRGELRFVRVANRIRYQGRWALDWLWLQSEARA